MGKTTRRRRYKNPPLMEAVIEFQFESAQNWDSVNFGRIYDQLKNFPDVESLFNASLEIGAERVAVGPQTEVKRFWRKDRGMAVTIGPDLLAVSALPPRMAEGHRWESLRDVAFTIFKLYTAITKPGPVRQTGLRYINRIDVDAEAFRLDRYVSDSSGLVPEAILMEKNPFSLRIERVTKATQAYHLREAVTIAALPQFPGNGQLVLDVDQIAIWSRQPKAAIIRSLYEQMHDAVHAVFTRVVRSEVLDTFNPLHDDESGA